MSPDQSITEAQMAQWGAHLRGQTWGYCNPYHGRPDNRRQRERLKRRGAGHMPSVSVCASVCVCVLSEAVPSVQAARSFQACADLVHARENSVLS